MRREGRVAVAGRVKVDDVREAMGASIAGAPASIDVLRARSRLDCDSSSGVTEKLVRTALHQASILVPSLLKLRRRFIPGDTAVTELRDTERESGAEGWAGTGTEVGAEVGFGWKLHPGVVAEVAKGSCCLGGSGVRNPSVVPKFSPAVVASNGLYSTAVRDEAASERVKRIE